MQINIQPNAQFPNTTNLIVGRDIGLYVLVTFDGDMAGTYSVLIPDSEGWDYLNDDDNATIKAAVLAWFGMTEQT